jgi:diguanylate cyclase (GGDEF)-like protein
VSAVAKEDAIPTAEMTPRVRELLASLTDEVEVLRRDLQSTRDRLELAERVADQDHLLTVLNRRAFVRELARHIGLVARYGTPASLLYLDLDGFKRINDTYGHACGDAVLAHFAQLLSVNVRDSDIVGRLGGDEFAILLAHATPAQAERKASSLLDALAAQPPLWNEKRLAVSFSFGAIALLAADTPDLAMMRADEGMYAQKRANR